VSNIELKFDILVSVKKKKKFNVVLRPVEDGEIKFLAPSFHRMRVQVRTAA